MCQTHLSSSLHTLMHVEVCQGYNEQNFNSIGNLITIVH